ncbi:MAG: hypothetical protein JKX85_02810 [Phycisphaeraceae bacterium]|nr:hypothetical protein [Phycisphaeraceae bacterium]
MTTPLQKLETIQTTIEKLQTNLEDWSSSVKNEDHLYMPFLQSWRDTLLGPNDPTSAQFLFAVSGVAI